MSISRDYWVYLDITCKKFEIWEFWVWVWGIETFHRSQIDPATGFTAHSEPLPFSELAETQSRQVIHISIRVLGWSWVWYKLSWKRRKLGWVSQTLSRISLVLAGAVAAFFWDNGEVLSGFKLYILETMTCSWHAQNYSMPIGWTATFVWPRMLFWTIPIRSVGSWLLEACFSWEKNHNVSGPHLFQIFTTHSKNNPLPP